MLIEILTEVARDLHRENRYTYFYYETGLFGEPLQRSITTDNFLSEKTRKALGYDVHYQGPGRWTRHFIVTLKNDKKLSVESVGPAHLYEIQRKFKAFYVVPA